MEDEGLKRQVQSLKRELKGWEAMFERKHGHKPTKTDIEESADEIRETYREYKKVKSRLSGEGSAEKKVKRVHFEDDVSCQRSPSPPTCTKEGGVFGTSLNKKPKKKMNGDFYVGERREEERKSVWKLRRWSKSRGHHTVVVKKEEEEKEGREDEGEQSMAREKKDKDMAESATNMEERENEIECDLTAELEQLSQGVYFKDLTAKREHHPSAVLNSLTQEQEREDSKPAAFVPMAGQCSNRLHFNMASRSPIKSKTASGGVKLKHCRNVSQTWLERCKPDLTEFDSGLPTEKLSGSEGEVERSSEGEESEGEIEENSELDEGDGLCEEDLWEEEEEGEGEEQGVEPEAFDLEEHIHDNQGEQHHSPLLYDDDLNRVVGHSNLDLDDRRSGYSWDDNDEGSSHDDSSSEDNLVINSSFGEQFDTKWEELSNSVKTLSPLKQLPVIKLSSSSSSSQATTTSSRSSKKRLILTPRTTSIPSQSSIKTASCHASVTASTTQYSTSSTPLEYSTDDSKRTGLSHLRDGMSLLELYRSKGQPAASQARSSLSLIQQLSPNAESANKHPTNNQSSDKTSQFTLQPSAHSRNSVNTASSTTQLGCDIPKQISASDLPSHQSNAKAQPPSTQTPKNPTSNREEPRLTAPGSKSESILATLDHEVDLSRRQEGTDLSKMVNVESDMDLLSQEEEPYVSRSRGSSAVSMATTFRGRSLRRDRERERVHSTAAVLSQVERMEHREEADTHTACGESGITALKCGVEKDTEIGERERKLNFSSTKSASVSGHSTATPNIALSTTDSGGGTSSDVGRGHRRGKAVSDNFVRLNMKVKKFSKRPGRSLSGSAYKRHMWKKRQNQETGSGVGGTGRGGARKGGRNICFKCGKPGHWAKNCTDKGGSKNLGTFAGEAVKFDDSLALGREDDVDSEMLEELAKNSPFPTVQEAAMMARGINVKSKAATAQASEQDEVGETDGGGGENADSSTYVAPPPCHTHSTPPPPSVEPLYPLTEEGHIISTPKCVFDTLRKFGYSSFRPGQEQAIMNILSGVSTLVIHSTGSGKSLCYQLPAYLYSQSHSDSPCITLVISPLVSLMEDQVRHFPHGVKGACLHTNQTRPQREKVLCNVVEGRINVLLLSPEALVGGAFWSGRGSPYSLRQLPPVAFACIDEVHCVSEWSHNFRPSYLRIHKVLQERLGVHCVLGLTATATHTTALSVADHLAIDHTKIIRGSILPGNLHISVSCDQDRDQALVELLQSSKFRDCESIIIYCTRQQQTERVAQLLRTCLQSLPAPAGGIGMEDLDSDPPANNNDGSSTTGKAKSRKRRSKNSMSTTSRKRQRMEWSAESYHAGMAASQRKKVQNDFMSGRVRIVVATVAFGMGLNKADVRAIIHYNMPKSFESFVQEIGRAGRDGEPAYCHVFIDKEGSDICELRRHAYSNTVDPYTVKQLVGKAFPVCHCREQKQMQQPQSSPPETPPTSSSDSTHSSPPPTLHSPRWCVGHEVAIPIEEMVQRLDVKEECISTLLCYLELQGWLEVLNVVNDSCTLKCYGGARQLRALAQKVPAVAAGAARLREKGTDLDHCGEMTFSVIEIASSMGWESHIVRSELSGLQYNDRGTSGSSLNGARSTVLVEFSCLAFHIRAPGDFMPEGRDHVCEFLTKKVKSQEEREVEKLHLLHAVLQSISKNSHYNCERNDIESETAMNECTPAVGAKQSQITLRDMIHRYFGSEGLDRTFLSNLGIPLLPVLQEITPEQKQQVRSDVHSLITVHSDLKFTGRTIARIFHGIASPLFPAEVWGRQYRFWRKYLSVDFNTLCQIATVKLLELR